MKSVNNAVENFTSVWPYDENYSLMMQGPGGYYRRSSDIGIGEFSILVCTREEFEAASGSKA